MAVEYYNSDRNVLITDTLAGTSTSVLFNTKMPYSRFTVQITPTSGNATVYVSNDNENWIEWDIGSVSVSTIDVCESVACIKVVNTTSTSTSIGIWGSL